jgi:hypothetical protein
MQKETLTENLFFSFHSRRHHSYITIMASEGANTSYHLPPVEEADTTL